MEQRTAKAIIAKSGGNASRNAYGCKVSLPKVWLDNMGITPEKREITLSFDGDRITIERPERSPIKRIPLADKYKIHESALFWMYMYENHSTIPFLNFKDNLILGCNLADLGFEMDCGKSYCEFFGEMNLPDNERLQHFLPEMDIQILGNLIYSQWRYWNHWSDYNYMKEADYQWFVIAFSRLAEITKG